MSSAKFIHVISPLVVAATVFCIGVFRDSSRDHLPPNAPGDAVEYKFTGLSGGQGSINKLRGVGID